MNKINETRSGNSVYFSKSFTSIFCLIMAVFALMLSSCGNDGPEPTDTSPTPPVSSTPDIAPSPTGSPETPEPTDTPAGEPATLLAESEDAGQEYIDRMIFLGDSTTNGLRSYGMLSDGKDTMQVWTPTSGTLTLAYHSTATIVYPDSSEEISIVDAVTRKKPDILVITLGVNGVSFMDEEYFKAEYTKLIEGILEASPGTKIICNSIYPVENDYKYIGDINNTNIPAANGWIYDVAVATGTRYTDSASVLKAGDGSLDESLGNGDGIHLGPDGYQAVLDYLRTHAYK